MYLLITVGRCSSAGRSRRRLPARARARRPAEPARPPSRPTVSPDRAAGIVARDLRARDGVPDLFVLYYFVNWKYLSTVWPLKRRRGSSLFFDLKGGSDLVIESPRWLRMAAPPCRAQPGWRKTGAARRLHSRSPRRPQPARSTSTRARHRYAHDAHRRRPFVTGLACAIPMAWRRLRIAACADPRSWPRSRGPARRALRVLGAFTYGVVYTVWLKRRTWWNIVVGGLAGSFAVLAGAGAVTPGEDRLGPPRARRRVVPVDAAALY